MTARDDDTQHDDDTSDDDTSQDDAADQSQDDDSSSDDDKLRAEARKHRKGKAEEKARADGLQEQIDALKPTLDQFKSVQKALGLGGDDSGDDSSQDATAEVERLQGELTQERTSRRVENLAASQGADGELVSAYLASSGKLEGVDPGDSERLETLVAEAIEAKPALMNSKQERKKTAADLDDETSEGLDELDMAAYVAKRGRRRALKR